MYGYYMHLLDILKGCKLFRGYFKHQTIVIVRKVLGKMEYWTITFFKLKFYDFFKNEYLSVEDRYKIYNTMEHIFFFIMQCYGIANHIIILEINNFCRCSTFLNTMRYLKNRKNSFPLFNFIPK